MMRLTILTACLIVFCFVAPACAQHQGDNHERTISSQIPLQAELLVPLNVTKLTRGASVLAKATIDWNDPACHLRVGSVIVGHVIDFEPRSNQNKAIKPHPCLRSR